MMHRLADIRDKGLTSIAGAEKYEPYPVYKDSGVEWLGEVPVHWEVKRLKYLTHISSGFTLPQSFDRYEGKYPVYGSNGRIGYCDRHLIAHQAIVIGRVGASGTVNVVPERSWISDNALIVRIVGQTQLLWLRYILQAANLGEHAAKNAQPIITATFVGDQALATPTNSEQHAIAAFLDRETAKIDALVARKERLIELLQEKRTALITQAVTKGLDPDVPMKDSGVEWLGEIPEHWEVKQLRWAITFQRGHDLPSDDREQGDVPVVSSSGISSMHSKAIAKAPGIVTGRYGTIGQFYLINQSYWPLNTTLYSIDLHENEPRFLLYMLMHMSSLFLLHSVKSAVPGVDRNDVHADHTAVPLLHEQHAIAAFLDLETAKIDALIAKIQEAIDLLKEQRTALISAAVTGKIDVREAIV